MSVVIIGSLVPALSAHLSFKSLYEFGLSFALNSIRCNCSSSRFPAKTILKHFSIPRPSFQTGNVIGFFIVISGYRRLSHCVLFNKLLKGLSHQIRFA